MRSVLPESVADQEAEYMMIERGGRRQTSSTWGTVLPSKNLDHLLGMEDAREIRKQAHDKYVQVAAAAGREAALSKGPRKLRKLIVPTMRQTCAREEAAKLLPHVYGCFVSHDAALSVQGELSL